MARKDVFENVMRSSHAAPPDVMPSFLKRSATRSIIQSFEDLSRDKIVEISTDLLDDSFVLDRLDDEPNEFMALVESIRVNGQDSPILVRPHPADPTRYQVVFGHRRVRAARQLSRQVKAIVRAVDDRDHIIAQGQENAIRKNLSFIERTLFVKHILESGQPIETAVAALALDDTTLSKMRSVLSNVPEPLIRLIGPAKSTGRDRWWHLSKVLEGRNDLADLPEKIDDFAQLSSDARFERVFDIATLKSHEVANRTSISREWGASDKSVKAKITEDAKSFTLAFKARDAVRFGAYISEKLDRLYADFREAEKRETNRS